MASKLLISFFLAFGIAGVTFADSGQCIYSDAPGGCGPLEIIQWDTADGSAVNTKCARTTEVSTSTCGEQDQYLYIVPPGVTFCTETMYLYITKALTVDVMECFVDASWDTDNNGVFDDFAHPQMQIGVASGVNTKGESVGTVGNITGVNGSCFSEGNALQVRYTDVANGSDDCDALIAVKGTITGVIMGKSL